MKFTIRDLFLVTMIVALALGWGVDTYRWHTRENNFRETIQVLQRLAEQNGSATTVNAEGRLTTAKAILPLPDSSAPAPNPPKP
jgi:hypothetical protein